MSLPQITLDQIASIQHVPTFNQVVNALASSALFGIMQKRSRGLNLWLYGGTFTTSDGIPTKLSNTKLALTPSATNYIYVLTNGTLQRDTAAPMGWPGPMANGARALYELAVGTNAITSGTCYLLSRSVPGPKGVAGAVGPAGDALWKQRSRYTLVVGAGDSFTPTSFGLTITNSSFSGRATNWQSGVDYPEWVPQVALFNGHYRTGNIHCRTRGFEVFLRWSIDTTFTHAGQRSFIGLYDTTFGTIVGTQPSALVNVFGVGADSGDSTLYLIHNDGSGTATKLLLQSDSSPTVTFPARSANRLYELRIWCDEGGTGFNYTFADHLGNLTSGFVTSDIPAIGQFLGWTFHCDPNGGATVTLNLMMASSNSRY